jgi:hypothetical protein
MPSGAEAVAEVDATTTLPPSTAASCTLRTALVGRLVTRLTSPPGALMPACVPLMPLSTSTRSLLASSSAVSALMGRPSRR